jgi:hypothetical protein
LALAARVNVAVVGQEPLVVALANGPVRLIPDTFNVPAPVLLIVITLLVAVEPIAVCGNTIELGDTLATGISSLEAVFDQSELAVTFA